MRLSYKWLSEYVDLSGISPKELADRLTLAGLEVEGIETMASGTHLVIGEVMDCRKHPDSDHLNVTRTRIGDRPEDVYQIVCGAPNCRRGLKVIVAMVGAELPGGIIGAKPVRGEESNGMLCSLLELGVDEKNLTDAQKAGIEELPADAPVGCTDVLGYLGLDDVILDISLTPNRADCSAMWNMAKEVAAVLKREAYWPDCKGKSDAGLPSTFKVVSETEQCPVFLGKAIHHVEIGPSPKWLVQRLQAYGMNSINNVVDISNYVMIETGQPLHFYNLAKLPLREIRVVDDRELTIKALDGKEFEIQKGDILITTGGEPTGIAGIMGGEESMIDETTEGIFIESALFNQAQVRRTSSRLNLTTEAAQRFSKGLEPLSQKKAMDRAVQLLTEYAGAEKMEETVIAGRIDYEPRIVTETLTHCNQLLGTRFTMEEIREVLTLLDFAPEIDGDSIICHIPSYRVDIEGRADIDEEIIRLIGYDALETTLPQMPSTVGALTPAQQLRRVTRDTLAGFGFNEIMTYTLIGQKDAEDACMPAGSPVKLAMPMSEARSHVRPSLMHSVLETLKFNQDHGNADNCLYELSMVYGAGVQDERLAIVMDGTFYSDPLHKNSWNTDFYTLKGVLFSWIEHLGYTGSRIKLKENHTDEKHFHPYRSAELYLDGRKLGVFGELHPQFSESLGLKKVYYAEISLTPLREARPAKLKFVSTAKYPSVIRDIALVVSRDTTAESILNTVRRSGSSIVRQSEIFDVYEGEHVSEGMKSVALRIVYRSDEKTLTDQEVQEAHQRILDGLRSNLKAELRS